MQELIREVKSTRTYITYTDTSEIDKKVRIIYNTFCSEILKKQFVSNKEFMAHYFPVDGPEKSLISIKKDSESLTYVVIIEKSLYKNLPNTKQSVHLQLKVIS
jgi:hypothetical protein